MIDEGKVNDDEGPAFKKLADIRLGSSIDESTYLWKGPSANNFIVPEAPPTIRYIRDFITPEEEELFLTEVYAAPKPKWQQLLNRRLQNWGGIVGKKALISDDNIPKWLNFAIDKLMSLPDAFPASNRPNHVLINEYQPGQGIMVSRHTRMDLRSIHWFRPSRWAAISFSITTVPYVRRTPFLKNCVMWGRCFLNVAVLF
uniref:Alpha-ketoglutarate-dependent dioxygenase ABH6 n=1 Tax=Ascaris suum TaxID=6253 RepID=F1LBN1_ASCSU